MAGTSTLNPTQGGSHLTVVHDTEQDTARAHRDLRADGRGDVQRHDKHRGTATIRLTVAGKATLKEAGD